MNQICAYNPKSYFAYIRVSTAKQGTHGVSLQEQKEAITRYAERNGLSIAQWFEERETAAKRGRPVFTQMLKRLRSGRVHGVLIHKIDRSARNLKDWAELGQLIDNGVQVQFCHEGLDLLSRGGRLSADIQAVVAADFIRNLRDETRKGIMGRLKQGLYPFSAPLGYLDCGGGQPKEPDPKTAPHVTWAFERYATSRVGLHELNEELYQRGLRNKRDGRVSLNGLSRMLNNPFYMGVIRIKRTRETFEGIHEPLISVGVFKHVQDVLHGRCPRRVLKHDLLFRRLLKCKLCGNSLIGEVQKGHVYYRCQSKPCPTTCVREEAVEMAAKNVLSAIKPAKHEAAEIHCYIGQLRSNWKRDQEDIAVTQNANLTQIQARLDRLTDAYVDGTLDKDIYVDRKERLIIERQAIKDKIAASPKSADAAALRLEKFLELSKTAYQSYEMGNPRQKRELLEIVTSNRWLVGKNVELEPRFPFSELQNRHSFTSGDPHRGTDRTFQTSQQVPNVPQVPGVNKFKGKISRRIHSIIKRMEQETDAEESW